MPPGKIPKTPTEFSNGSSDMLTRLKEFFADAQTPAFLVGGCLRDALLSLPPGRDVDIAVDGDVLGLAQQLSRVLGGTLVPLSPALGKVRVVVSESSLDKQTDRWAECWTIDLSGFSGSIEEDLARRDFTVDALALPVSDWDPDALGKSAFETVLIDPLNGRSDLDRKCIRAVGPSVFRDDPVRLLRAVRLCSALGFRLEPDTARMALADAAHVTEPAPERVRDELLAILALDGAKGSLEVLDRLDLLCRVIPELAATKGVEQPLVHYWDVWGHTLHAVEGAERVTKGHQHSPVFTLVYWTAETNAYFNQKVAEGLTRRTLLKLAALFHDISKPQTKHVDETGRTRFPGHSEAGAAVAAQRLSQLRLSSQGIDMVSKMVEHHLRPHHMMQGVELPTRRAINRYFRDLDGVAVDTLYLSQADFLAAKGPDLNPDDWANHARMVAHIVQAGFQPTTSEAAQRLINGNELIEHFKLSPGPIVGLLLEGINDAQAAGEISTPEQAWELAGHIMRQHQDKG